MEQIGVEAVVQGLGRFVSDIGKLNSSLKSIEPSGNIVTRAIDGVSNAFSGLLGFMGRVAETALGFLVRDAFLAVVNGLREVISATIEAGSEFQSLQIRLTRLDLNTVFQEAAQNAEEFTNVMRASRSEYRIQKMEWQKAPTLAQAMDVATQAAKEQLTWVQKLAATTPFDFEDIAQVYTLARSYSFADDQARQLTQDIADFSAGMGLSGVEINRIIVNMGQMVQQGKVTAREMNDLARGAFVPVNDILDIMKEKTGLAGAAFDDFRNSAEGVDLFMKSFSELVQTRFKGASEDMARTFKGATDNAKDFIKSVFGFGLVMPILDKVGGKIADIITGLTSEGNFAAITVAVQRFGEAISEFIGDILDLGNLNTGAIVQWLLQTVNRATAWLKQNGKNLIQSVKDIIAKIQDAFTKLKSGNISGFLGVLGINQSVIDKVTKFKDMIVEAIDTIKAWIDANRPTIDEFFSSLGEIIAIVIENLTGKKIDTEGGITTILDGIKTFMQYVIDNKEGIAEFITKLVELWGIMQLIGFVMSIVLPPLISLVSIILSIIGVVIGAISVFQVLAAVLGLILSPIGLIIIGIIALGAMIWWLAANWQTVTENMNTAWQTVLEVFTMIKDGIVAGWQEWLANARALMGSMRDTFTENVHSIWDLFNADLWVKLGKQVMEGIGKGLKDAAQNVYDTLKKIAESIKDLFTGIMGAHSPSTVFADYGKDLMEGLAIGIERSSGLAAKAMQNAIAGVASPAVYATAEMGGAVSTQNNYTNNYNLTVNSSSPSEPIVQDYNMLQSLAGA